MVYESLRRQIEKKCIHFNGILNEVCKAGVSYASKKDLPCVRKSVDISEKPTTCTSCEWPTEEYVIKKIKEADECSKRLQKVNVVIQNAIAEHDDEDWSSIEICPVCGGKLHISYASYNGHTCGKCETTDCLSWIE